MGPKKIHSLKQMFFSSSYFSPPSQGTIFFIFFVSVWECFISVCLSFSQHPFFESLFCVHLFLSSFFYIPPLYSCFSLYLSVFVFLCIFLSLFFFCVCFSFYLSFCQRLPFMFVSLSFYLSSFICPPAFWVYVVSLKCNLHTAMMMSRQMNRVALHTPHWAESWDRHSRPWEWRRKEGLHFKGTRFNNFNFEKSYVCMNKV